MDFEKLLKQAQAMQKELEKKSEEIAEKEYEGSESNGLVKVKINGENNALSVKIDPSILNPEDEEMIEELLVIAINDAVNRLHNDQEDVFGGMIPGI